MNTAVAVAATDASDQKASYSSYGNWVDISAPGSPMPSSDESESAKVSTLTGTSFAGAIVAGAAALVWSVDPTLSSQRVQDILLNTADNIDDRNPGFEQKLGSGRLNVLKAVRNVQNRSS